MSIATIDTKGDCARTGSTTDRSYDRDGPRGRVEKDPVRIVGMLRKKLEDHHRCCARRAGWTRRTVPTALTAVDAALPRGGLPCGAITEILSDEPGVGSMSLAMRIAVQSVGDGQNRRSIILVDTFGDFYPPAACQHGIALDRLIIIRTKNEKDAFWVVDQSLRCSAVATVIAPLMGLDERLSRRLQLAAASSGCLGLILRPRPQRAKSFAAIRMLVEKVEHGESIRSPQYRCLITLLTVREGTPTEPLLVDLQHETGALPLPPLPVDRPAAKTG